MATETKSTVLLKHHLKKLKLPTMVQECEKVAQRCAKENVDSLGFLLQLTELELEQHMKDEISLRLRAKMTLEWGPNREDPDSLNTDYEYETPDRHVDDWLLEDGAAFGAGFTEGIDAIAGQMSRDIFSPEPR